MAFFNNGSDDDSYFEKPKPYSPDSKENKKRG